MKNIYLLTFVLSLTIPAISQPPTTSLKVWYDADVSVATNVSGEVTSWGDNSGNSFHASAVLTGATLETVTGNDGSNYSFVRFAGNSFLSSTYGGSATGSATIFIVFNNAQVPSHAIHFSNINDSVVYPSANYRAKYGVEISTDPNPQEKSLGSGVTGRNFEVVAFRYEQNRTIAGVSTWRNGFMLSGRTAPDLPITALPLYIGGYANASQSTLATADIAQVLVYDAALSESDMGAAFSYLMTRYNLADNQFPFTNIQSGQWNDPSTWAGGMVPGPSDDVIIASMGTFEWVDITQGVSSCKSLTILENSGLRVIYQSVDVPVLNVGVGNGNNNEMAVKGSLVLDSSILNIDGNLYITSNQSDTLTEGFEFGGSAVINIDGNNGDPSESVSADRTILSILQFNFNYGSSSRLNAYVFGKCFITIVDPHLDANGVTISGFTGSYVTAPEERSAHNGYLQFGDGISTEGTNNPDGFVVSGDALFPMKVIANSTTINNRKITVDNLGFVNYNAGIQVNAGASFTNNGYILISWDLENNGTYIQRGAINISTLGMHQDSMAIKGTGVYDMSDPFLPVQFSVTGGQDAIIRKIGIFSSLTIDYGKFLAPNMRVYLFNNFSINYTWQKSLMEEESWSLPDPSYFICRGPFKLINNLPLTPMDTLRFYLGLDDVFAPAMLAIHGGQDLYFASVNRPVTDGPNKPDLLDFEWRIDKASPGGNTDIVFQWSKSKELFVPDTTTIVARRFSAGTWQDRTTQTDQNSFYPNTRQCTATGITAFSPFSIAASPLTTLPVELLTFDAEKKNESTLLTWKTAQEFNSQIFEIERATDNNRFIKIGTVAAAGNTNAETNYFFTDMHPMDGVNYYRLKQVDIDGQFDYSKTIPVNFGKPDKLLLSPNPATSTLNIKLPKDKRYSSLHILDATGKIVLWQAITGSAINISLDIQRLPKGWYVLKIAGDESLQQSFLKQ